MTVGQVSRYTSYAQDGVVSTIDAKFSWLAPKFFSTVKQFTTEFIEWDITEGGIRIAGFSSPMSLGKSTRETGYRTYQIKPAYIKLLDTVRPGEGFVRMPGEQYGGSLSPEQRLAIKTAQKIVTHREMIETRWEKMAADVLVDAKLTIMDDDYPTAIVDFERDPNLMMNAATLWNAPGADPLTDIVVLADQINTSSRGAIGNTLIMRTSVYDMMMLNVRVRDLVDVSKNLSPGTSGLEFGPRSSNRAPQFRGRISGQYDIWTYDGYYTDDTGASIAFLPSDKVIMISDQSIEGSRYHGAIFDMDADMGAVEVFVKTRRLWNPSGEEVLTQSAPMLGMKRPNASGTIKVK